MMSELRRELEGLKQVVYKHEARIEHLEKQLNHDKAESTSQENESQ